MFCHAPDSEHWAVQRCGVSCPLACHRPTAEPQQVRSGSGGKRATGWQDPQRRIKTFRPECSSAFPIAQCTPGAAWDQEMNGGAGRAPCLWGAVFTGEADAWTGTRKRPGNADNLGPHGFCPQPASLCPAMQGLSAACVLGGRSADAECKIPARPLSRSAVQPATSALHTLVPYP